MLKYHENLTDGEPSCKHETTHGETSYKHDVKNPITTTAFKTHHDTTCSKDTTEQRFAILSRILRSGKKNNLHIWHRSRFYAF